MLMKVKLVEMTNPGINFVRFRADGKLFGTAGWDGQIRLFSGKKLTALAVLSYHKSSVQTLAFATDNILAAGCKDGLISVWNVYK